MLPGSAASAKTPTDSSASTCQKEPTCPYFPSNNSTTSHGGSTRGPEKLWDGKRPLNSSSQKALSTSSNTGQLKSNPLHLYLESTLPHGSPHMPIPPKPSAEPIAALATAPRSRKKSSSSSRQRCPSCF